MGPQLIVPSVTTGPNQFGHHGQRVPKNLVAMDKWSPTNLVPLDKWSLEYSNCPGVQALGIRKYRVQILRDHLSMRFEFVGDHLSRGINFTGIVCV